MPSKLYDDRSVAAKTCYVRQRHPDDIMVPEVCPDRSQHGLLTALWEALYVSEGAAGHHLLREDLFLAGDFFFAGDLPAVDLFEAGFFAADFLGALFFFGTLAPSFLASESPIAIACLRLVTFFPLRPLFSCPCFFSCIAFSTLFCDFLEYFAIFNRFYCSRSPG